MRKSDHTQEIDPPKTHDAAVGATLTLATVIPIFIGSATVILRWPIAMLNISIGVCVVASVEALFQCHIAKLAAQMHTRDAVMDERDNAWRKTVHKIQGEINELKTVIAQAVKESRVYQDREQVRRADLRAIRSGSND